MCSPVRSSLRSFGPSEVLDVLPIHFGSGRSDRAAIYVLLKQVMACRMWLVLMSREFVVNVYSLLKSLVKNYHETSDILSLGSIARSSPTVRSEIASSALTLLVGCQEEHPACKK